MPFSPYNDDARLSNKVKSINNDARSQVPDMPRVTDIMILGQKEQDTIVIRTRTDVNSLMRVIGEAYARIFAYLAELKEDPADMPFVTYHNMDMNDLDVEIGVPVSRQLPSRADMTAGKIPKGKMVMCIFRGPYSGTEGTYNEVREWMTKNGCRPSGIVRESYYNDPVNFSEEELLTRLEFPIE
jgi:effector-binding domain-containing protein